MWSSVLLDLKQTKFDTFGAETSGSANGTIAYATIMSMRIDLKRQYRFLYAPKTTPQLVDVPPLQYLMIDGQGAPEGQLFQEGLQALYSTAYSLKYSLRSDGRANFVVAPLEAQWCCDDPTAFSENRRDDWQWTMMILQPEPVKADDLAATLDALANKRKKIAAHDRVRLATLEEGRAVQALHIGPYGEQGPTIDSLRVYAESKGYELVGKHHEIYLSDPRRVVPERLKTIIRQPVA